MSQTKRRGRKKREKKKDARGDERFRTGAKIYREEPQNLTSERKGGREREKRKGVEPRPRLPNHELLDPSRSLDPDIFRDTKQKSPEEQDSVKSTRKWDSECYGYNKSVPEEEVSQSPRWAEGLLVCALGNLFA